MTFANKGLPNNDLKETGIANTLEIIIDENG